MDKFWKGQEQWEVKEVLEDLIRKTTYKLSMALRLRTNLVVF